MADRGGLSFVALATGQATLVCPSRSWKQSCRLPTLFGGDAIAKGEEDEEAPGGGPRNSFFVRVDLAEMEQ